MRYYRISYFQVGEAVGGHVGGFGLPIYGMKQAEEKLADVLRQLEFEGYPVTRGKRAGVAVDPGVDVTALVWIEPVCHKSGQSKPMTTVFVEQYMAMEV
jgi:hypothetical protein